jgi:hypothetical protein
MVSTFYRMNKHQDHHGTIHNLLSVITIITTIFFITFLKPHRLYKRLMSWFFNFSFKWKGAQWKIYHVLSFVIFIFTMLFLSNHINFIHFSFENANRDICLSRS